ncbi:hypothetical protein T03_13169 [Trichinella britovi]|uniref:Uncharacterized protein n=1 Tax=Trichinella britovi TaxID=45882 RepID=A0A0V1CK41_TRIBR|nr:hypothetical protein T03_13169 [Trichinella britovi]
MDEWHGWCKEWLSKNFDLALTSQVNNNDQWGMFIFGNRRIGTKERGLLTALAKPKQHGQIRAEGNGQLKLFNAAFATVPGDCCHWPASSLRNQIFNACSPIRILILLR